MKYYFSIFFSKNFERKNVITLRDSCAEQDVAFAVSGLYSKIQAKARASHHTSHLARLAVLCVETRQYVR